MSASDRWYLQFTAWLVVAVLHPDFIVKLAALGVAALFGFFFLYCKSERAS